MNELIDLILRLSEDIKMLKLQLQMIGKRPLDRFKENWLDGQQVMDALGISRRTLQSLRDSGELPFTRLRGKLYYKLSDLERLLESNYHNSKTREK